MRGADHEVYGGPRLYVGEDPSIYHGSFDDPSKEGEILGPMPGEGDYELRRRQSRAPKGVPPELATCYEWPLLTREQEAHLFRKMNFLKHRAWKTGSVEDRRGAEDITRRLVCANLRLVVSIVKKFHRGSDGFFESLSDGNLSLLRAVAKFDFSRGFKFSTYASWAIVRNFAGERPDELRRRERFSTGHNALLEECPEEEGPEAWEAREAAYKVECLLDYLDERDRMVIRLRAGLAGSSGVPLRYKDIAEELGLSKERVRQITKRVMAKLADLAAFGAQP